MLDRRWNALQRTFLLMTDLGFLAYWVITFLHVLPASWLFHGYAEPTTQAWNLSFLPLDAIVSLSGIASVMLARRCPSSARTLLVVSLVTTSISGLQALSFWTLRHDFDITWWLPNAFLLAWPLPFLARMIWAVEPAPRAVRS